MGKEMRRKPPSNTAEQANLIKPERRSKRLVSDPKDLSFAANLLVLANQAATAEEDKSLPAAIEDGNRKGGDASQGKRELMMQQSVKAAILHRSLKRRVKNKSSSGLQVCKRFVGNGTLKQFSSGDLLILANEAASLQQRGKAAAQATVKVAQEAEQQQSFKKKRDHHHLVSTSLGDVAGTSNPAKKLCRHNVDDAQREGTIAAVVPEKKQPLYAHFGSKGDSRDCLYAAWERGVTKKKRSQCRRKPKMMKWGSSLGKSCDQINTDAGKQLEACDDIDCGKSSFGLPVKKIVAEGEPKRDPSDDGFRGNNKLFEKKYVRRKKLRNKAYLESTTSVGAAVAGTSNPPAKKLCRDKPSSVEDAQREAVEGQGRLIFQLLVSKYQDNDEEENTVSEADLSQSVKGSDNASNEEMTDSESEETKTEEEEEQEEEDVSDVSDVSDGSSSCKWLSFTTQPRTFKGLRHVHWSDKKKRSCLTSEETESDRKILILAVEAITHQLGLLDVSVEENMTT